MGFVPATGVRRPALRLVTAACLIGSVGLAGCGGGDAATPAAAPSAKATATSVIAPAVLRPGQPVPAPDGKPVLTVSGKIAEKNRGRTLALDTGTLDRFGISKVSAYEPWTKKTMAFQGIWLADLLKVAGADASSRGVQMTALDDYKVELSMAEIRAGGIFLATKSGDGTAIPIDAGGPTRIVFVGGVPSGENADQWIWSLKSLDVQ